MAGCENEEDDKINVLSDNFDALSALYSENVILPWKKAPVLDNVSKYESLAEKSGGIISVDKVAAQQIQEQRKKREAATVEPFERSLSLLKPEDIDEEESKDEEKPRGKTKKFDNVFTLIEQAKGPLGFLKDCMRQRVRVKVWTRNRASIRGYSQGFVVAFDKHWNIALEDVTEVWTRNIKRKTVPMGIESEPPPHWKVKGPPLLPPPVEIVKKDKKTETCTRHLGQKVDQFYIKLTKNELVIDI